MALNINDEIGAIRASVGGYMGSYLPSRVEKLSKTGAGGVTAFKQDLLFARNKIDEAYAQLTATVLPRRQQIETRQYLLNSFVAYRDGISAAMTAVDTNTNIAWDTVDDCVKSAGEWIGSYESAVYSESLRKKVVKPW